MLVVPVLAIVEERVPDEGDRLEMYLPGYSDNGASAVVRAYIGPSDHGASLTAVLEKIGKKWKVKWLRISRYV